MLDVRKHTIRYLKITEPDKSIDRKSTTRGTSTLKENKLGLSVKQIMELSSNSFNTFYNKPIETSPSFLILICK